MMTFGEKLKKARVEAGYTQEEFSSVLAVSRSAIAKWESDRGMPDVTNLKYIAKTLNVSIDYLVEDGSELDLTITRKPIDLAKYSEGKKLTWSRKFDIKEKILWETFPEGEIMGLTITKIKNTKPDNVIDQVIGWMVLVFGSIPLFGVPEMVKMSNRLDRFYVLVREEKRQSLVLMTDEMMEIRTLAEPITERSFEFGDMTLMQTAPLKKKN